ncbi:MAG: Replicative DNA helicase (DnaB) [uncultured Thermomicrobiales bacterium]|uniref:Replicative DNA helicase n=1 Tax=uncultured Thermomicrobiales bacterium TaxID=1645740 RepID=A0A6J4UK27_9BACT|nr:MAG: Replicative DNA helicase (DnaB) [uncultured Thermomicrobiales bacterium]
MVALHAVDRLPPNNIDAEQSVLGSLLIDRDAIIRIDSFLRPEDFYLPSNVVIFRAIKELYQDRQPSDLVTLSDRLDHAGQLEQAGGTAYLASLLTAVPTSVHVEYYARIVERDAALRRLISAGTDIVEIGFEDSITTEIALDRAEKLILQISQQRTTRDFVPLDEVLEGIFNRITPNGDNRNAIVGVGTGYKDLDAMTGGFQRSDLIILAARPSMGKTAFALGITHGAALLHGKSVGIFSMEMSAEQLAYRLLSTETGIDSHRLRLGQVDDHEWERLSRALGRLSEAKIFIDDTAGAGIMEVRSKARRLMSEQGLDMIVVDYLQLMSSGRRNDNRVQEIAEISRGLKGLARELNVPVVALSQLSRAVETRSDHRPMLSDLRESGSIEQDADLVMFIYREDKYDEETDKRGIAEIILAKHRNGPVGSINLRFFEQTARFADLEVHRDASR